MALDLKLWAQLNLVGNVTWQDYLSMTPVEAEACLQALNDVLSESKSKGATQQSFDSLVDHYRKGMNGR